MDDNKAETRQERRERKLQKKKERIQKHGKGLVIVYREAILKRINKLRSNKGKGKQI